MFFRKTYILHAIISVIFTALGAPDLLASPLINVQGILEDSKGTPVNGKFDMEFRIYDKKIGGSELWGEKLEEVEVKDGIFGVYLGTDTLLTADIFAGDEPVYLGLIVGSGSEFPREQLVYLPYAVVSEEALHAAECGVLLGAAPDLDCDGCVDASELPGNVCYLDNAQTFTGSKSFDKPVAFDALGVSPFSVKSGVKVDNLNADMLDGIDSTGFASAVHDHDQAYYTKGSLDTTGTINQSSNPVDWTKLKNVPSGIADGIDDDTKYTAGTGLSLLSGVFSIDKGTVDGWYVKKGEADSITSDMILDKSILVKDIGQNSCSDGQVMKWSGSPDNRWECAEDLQEPGIGYTEGEGIDITGNTITAVKGVIQGWSKDVCYDTELELTTLLNDNYSDKAHVHNTSDITAGTLDNARLSASVSLLGQTIESSEIFDGTITNSDISAAAGIGYSKLNLGNSIVDSDIKSSAAIGYSKLNLSGSIVNSDISAAAGISDTKLSTITTAGKVADSALSSNVTKLGQFIESADITNATILFEDIGQNGCSDGKVIKWDNTNQRWVCGDDLNSGGTVTSVTAPSPLSSSGGNTPNISLSGIVPIANGGTGSSSKNFVDLTTAQTIAGDKTFSNNVAFNNTITGNISGNAGTVTNGVYTTGSYSNPSWITSLDAAKITTGTIDDNRLSLNVMLLNNSQTIAGSKTFNPSTGSVPFAVVSSKTGVVNNLNADMLDGIHSGDFSLSTHDHGSNYIMNGSAMQNADFNISGNGFINGFAGIGTQAIEGKMTIDGGTMASVSGPFNAVYVKQAYSFSATVNSPAGGVTSSVKSNISAGIYALYPYSIRGLLNATANAGTITSAIGLAGEAKNTSFNALSSGTGVEGVVKRAAGNVLAGFGGYFESSNADKAIGLYAIASGGKNNYAAIFNQGNVGINDLNPDEKLSVNGNVKASGAIMIAGNPAKVNPLPQVPKGNTITTVDSAGNVGFNGSITMGQDGLPVISYTDGSNADLKVVKCGNAACSAGNTITSIDTDGNVGEFTSIAIGADGLPVISYYTNTSQDLKVAKCGNAACSAGNTITPVDTTGNVGAYTSIAIGIDGLPVISYTDSTNADLKAAKCGNAACSAGNTITSIDTVGNFEWFTSIAIGTDGLPVIAYADTSNFDLKVAKCGNASCSSACGSGGTTCTTVDSLFTSGYTPSITIGTDGNPVISFARNMGVDYNLLVLKCGNPSCSAGNSTNPVEGAFSNGMYSSITIGADGNPIISYLDSTNSDLKVVKCGNSSCSSGNFIRTVDSTGNVGAYTSITIGTDGLPVVSYYDSSSLDLKVVKCSNPFCVSNWSRR